jgi:sugar phosphate isomerase/epimerase
MAKIGMASCAMMATRWINPLRIAEDNGFDAFEVSCVFPSAEPDNTPPHVIDKARDILEKSGMEICVHAPFHDMNIAAFTKGIRDESIRLIKLAIDLCSDLGGNVLIVHSGINTYRNDFQGSNRGNNPLLQLQWDHNIDSLKQINAYANSKGITVCLENICFSCIDQSFQDLIDIRSAVGSSLQFTLDFGHARLAEGPEVGIQTLGENIRHIHLTDNFGKNDDHLPVGDGDYDYSSIMDFLRNFPHIITLETVDISRDPKPVLRGFDAFKKMLGRYYE